MRNIQSHDVICKQKLMIIIDNIKQFGTIYSIFLTITSIISITLLEDKYKSIFMQFIGF